MTDINILLLTATVLGFTHTILGPAHYAPFIVLSKARRWNIGRTLFTTFYCGLGHLASSIIIGIVGIIIGLGIERVTFFDSFRGNLAGWAFFSFGVVYMAWGMFRAIKNKPHTHCNAHLNDKQHVHGNGKTNLTPWILFLIFALEPCEILAPLLMYPAAQHNIGAIISVSLLFSTVTILTMCVAVVIGYYGFKAIFTDKIDRFMHAIAGATICLSGLAILFLES